MLVFLGRVAVYTALVAYSDETFPLTICWSVCVSVCPVDCGKSGRSDLDAIWHGRSDGSRDEAGRGFGDRSWEGLILGANMGCPIVTNGDLLLLTYYCVVLCLRMK